jgi:hypothetical protein
MENKNIILALCEAKKEFKPIEKNKTNPGFKFDYADLGAYLDATQEALCKHGLFVTQTIDERGLSTTIRYAHSQDTIQSLIPLKETPTPQAFGSQLTYLRRYSYAAILGLASEDDDANESSKNDSKKEQPKQESKTANKTQAQKTPETKNIVKEYFYSLPKEASLLERGNDTIEWIKSNAQITIKEKAFDTMITFWQSIREQVEKNGKLEEWSKVFNSIPVEPKEAEVK